MTGIGSSSPSSFRIREEDPATILPELVALLKATRARPERLEDGHLRWKYLENPDGPAVVWTLRSASGALMGFTACLPRRMRVAGRDRWAWNGADFSILPEYRTLGPAVELRRQATQAIDAGRADFLYAHPNPRMAVIHRRVGHRLLGEMRRVARPLTMRGRLPTAGWKAPSAWLVQTLVDPLLRKSQKLLLGGRQVRIHPHVVFDARFDRLFAREEHAFEVVGVRDARYLNWRWGPGSGADPLLLTLESDREVQGFAILSRSDDGVRIRDLFPQHQPALVQTLVAAACRWSLEHHIPTVSLTALAGQPLFTTPRHRLFSQRPDVSEVFIYHPPGRTELEPVSRASAWCMTSGDRDS